MKNKILQIEICFLLLFIIMSCSKEPTKSLEDKSNSEEAPIITEILSPNPIVIAGYDDLTINGQNFSSIPENNGVMFDDTRAIVKSASSTQLIVKSPDVGGDSIYVKIWKYGAAEYSNTVLFSMEKAYAEFYPFNPPGKTEFETYALSMDQNDNMFLSLTYSDFGEGIKKINPTGELEDYANKGGETFYTGLKNGPNNTLIGVRGVRALFQIPEKTSPDPVSPVTWAVAPNTSLKFYDLDFDKYLNIWAVGDNDVIVNIKEDTTGAKIFTDYNFTGNIRSVRIYDDFLYVGGLINSEESVWRAPIISADSLGSFTQYFNLFSVTGYENGIVYAITFADDGYLYIGTNGVGGTDPILEISPGGTQASVLYPELIPAEVRFFTWGTDTYLYYTKGVVGDPNNYNTIYKVNVRKNSAPYFGRGDI